MLTLTGRGHPESGRAGNAAILALEDDKQIARMLELTLAGEGYRVIDAPTGRHAISRQRDRIRLPAAGEIVTPAGGNGLSHR